MSVRVVALEDKHVDETAELMIKGLKREPTTLALKHLNGGEDQTSAWYSWAHWFTTVALSHGLSQVAVTENDTVVGLCLSFKHTEEAAESFEVYNGEYSEFRAVQNLLDTIRQKYADARPDWPTANWKAPPPPPGEIDISHEGRALLNGSDPKFWRFLKTVRIAFLVVDAGWEGKGVAKRLVDASVEVQRSSRDPDGYPLFLRAYAECTSRKSRNVFEKCGFTELASLLYTEYDDKDIPGFFKPVQSFDGAFLVELQLAP
ncbi:hypothetical protein BJ742DRAFT_804390 [Cladochytrium replicatum]|nr:hypothetical protein BJ742DRAFT_804390 [Cladochytrium replicatum]